MANGAANLSRCNSYTIANRDIMGANSRTAKVGDFLKDGAAVSTLAAAGETILGVSNGSETGSAFDSDNQTVAMKRELYEPLGVEKSYLVEITGQLLDFGGAIASGSINLSVNGVATTAVSFDTSASKTYGLLATQLVTEFGASGTKTAGLIATATVASNTIKIVPINGNNTVVITAITATGLTPTVANYVPTVADEGYYFDITTTGQRADYTTKSASTGTLKLAKLVSAGTSTNGATVANAVGSFQIVNL